MLIHYRTLRKVLGIMALLFPVVLVLFGTSVMKSSLSAYYWSTAKDIFVGFLIAMGIFLVSYNGYDKADKIITTIPGISMMLLAIFPMSMESFTPNFLSSGVSNIIHYASAAITFIFLGIMSLTQFSRSDNFFRNRIYKICGYIILITIATMIPFIVSPYIMEVTDRFRLFFIQETVVLWAFGYSWLVKGMK